MGDRITVSYQFTTYHRPAFRLGAKRFGVNRTSLHLLKLTDELVRQRPTVKSVTIRGSNQPNLGMDIVFVDRKNGS